LHLGERFRRRVLALSVSFLVLFLAGCEQPQHENYLGDIVLHVLALRSAVSRTHPDFDTMLLDAQHIEASARELRTSYPDGSGRALVMKLQLHASELTLAAVAHDAPAIKKSLDAIESAVNELQALSTRCSMPRCGREPSHLMG